MSSYLEIYLSRQDLDVPLNASREYKHTVSQEITIEDKKKV